MDSTQNTIHNILNTNKKVIKFWKQLNFKKNGKSYYLKLKK